jgi:PKD repeat protein
MKSIHLFSQNSNTHLLGTLLYVLFALLAFLACNLPKVEGPGISDGSPVASFSASPTSGTAPLTVNITNNSRNAETYAWSFGDGQPNSSAEEPGTHVYAVAGTYSLRLTASAGGSSDDTTVVISVGAVGAPVADFTVTNDGCTAACSVSFSNASSNAVSQIWNFGDPGSGAMNQATSVNASHAYSSAGTYVVKLLVTSSGGTKDSITKNITIAAAPIQTWVSSIDLSAGTGFEFVKGIDQLQNGEIEVVSNNYAKIFQYKLSSSGTKLGGTAERTLGPEFDVLFSRYFRKTTSGYIVGGFTHYNGGTSPTDDFYALKLNTDFSLAGQNAFFDTDDGNEIGHGICQTDDGGYLLCGNKSSGANTGMLFIKLNSNLGVESRINKFTSSPSNSAIVIHNIVGGYVVTGKMLNASSGNIEGCFLRLDDSYNQVGTTKFLGDFAPEDILELSDGSFILLGDGASAGRAIRVTASNTTVWDKPYGRLMRRGVVTSDNQLVVVGSVAFPSFKIALYKIDISNGDLIWARESYTIPGSNSSQGLYVTQTPDGGFLMGGLNQKSSQESLVMKLKADGTQ